MSTNAAAHSRMAGTDFQTLTLGGKQYKLSPLKVGSYAELQAYYLSLRDDPLVLASRACNDPRIPPTQHATIWESAIKVASTMRIIPPGELADFEQSVHGRAFQFFCSIRANHPEIKSADEILPIFESITEGEMQELLIKLELVNNGPAIKNSSGPVETGPTANPSVGPSSTPSSQSDTTGTPSA